MRNVGGASASTESHFLNLPSELRVKIYRHYIPHEKTIAWNSRDSPYFWQPPRRLMDDPKQTTAGDWWTVPKDKRGSIFRVSRQVSAETLQILYSENTFAVKFLVPNLLRIPENGWLRIKRLRLLVDTKQDTSESSLEVGSTLWSSIFRNLEFLYFQYSLNQCFLCEQEIGHGEETKDPNYQYALYVRQFNIKEAQFLQWCTNITFCFQHMRTGGVVLEVNPTPCKRQERVIEQQLGSRGYEKIHSYDFEVEKLFGLRPKGKTLETVKAIKAHVPGNGLFTRILT